jgi:hypothetical protein
MKLYEAYNDEDIVEVLTKTLEDKADSKIFTFRTLGEVDDALEMVVVFENKMVLMGLINITGYEGRIACRVQGNFI